MTKWLNGTKEMAPIYRGKVCGLCGDYNLNKFHEFIGPDMCLHYNSTSFGNSYVIPSGECTAPEYRSPCTYTSKLIRAVTFSSPVNTL